MKRLFKGLLSFIFVMVLLTPITCFAEEIVEISVESKTTDIFTRIWEFVEENKTEAVSAAGSVLLLVAGGVVKIANSKEAKKLGELLNSIQGDTKRTNNAQASIIDVANQMIVGYNKMDESCGDLIEGYKDMKTVYEQNVSKEDDRNRLIGAMMVQMTTLIEMFCAVFVHNKNLPQGAKDLIILKYANMQKALSDDDMLCAIVESVREKINFEPSEEAETTQDDTGSVASEV